MPTFDAPALLLALHSAAAWGAPAGAGPPPADAPPPPGKFLAALLPHTQVCSGGRGARAQALALPVQGRDNDDDALLVRPPAQALLPSLRGPDLAQLLWSCVRLQVRPDESWMDAWMAGEAGDAVLNSPRGCRRAVLTVW